jgi:glycosyltransferase involved in cell wall biosynthesis
MKLGKSLSIVIPTLNEEKGVGETINSLPLDKLRQYGYDTEVLVIDGNSLDKTREVASALGARVIVENKSGYGRAYKTGFSYARGNLIATLDGDSTYPSEMIPDLIKYLEENQLDFITVNRFSKLEKGSMSRTHRLGNSILSLSLRILHSVNIEDSQSGMWILRKDLLDCINLISDDMAFSEELKIIAFGYFRSVEVEGRYSRRIGDAKLTTFGHGWKNLCYLWRYRKSKNSVIRHPAVSIPPKARIPS